MRENKYRGKKTYTERLLGGCRSCFDRICVRVFSFKWLSKGRLIASFNVYISNKFMDSLYYDGNEITFHIVNRFRYKYLKTKNKKLRQRKSFRENKKPVEDGKQIRTMCLFVFGLFPLVSSLLLFLLFYLP